MDGAQEDGKLGEEIPENTEESSRTGQMVSKVKKKANVQQDENHGVEKESSRRKEIGSPRKGVKGRSQQRNSDTGRVEETVNSIEKEIEEEN